MMNEKIIKIAKKINQAGGSLFIVGGFIRDQIMNVPSTDIDFAIEGITEDQAKRIVNIFANKPVEDVVSNAPVFMGHIDNESFEFAMCRKEVSIGRGKSAFTFISDPNITIFDDLIRRDFTMNAMAQDVLSGKIIDPFGGADDIRNRIIRHVSDHFAESPERIMRCASFAARFDFDVAPETMVIIQDMAANDAMDDIPGDQFRLHINKAVKKATNVQKFFDILHDVNCFGFTHKPIVGNPPSINGDMDTNTKLMLNADDNADFTIKVAWVISRMAKEVMNQDSFLDQIGAKRNVIILVKQFVHFDGFQPEPFVSGKDIIHLIKPGKEMGEMIQWIFDKQVNGEVKSKDEGIKLIQKRIKENER